MAAADEAAAAIDHGALALDVAMPATEKLDMDVAAAAVATTDDEEELLLLWLTFAVDIEAERL